MLVDVLAWIIIALGTLWAADALLPLTAVRGYLGRPGRGWHARHRRPERPDEPGAGKANWREFRKSLLVAATGVIWLVTEPRRDVAAEVLLGAAIVVIVAWELGSWLLARRAGGRGAAWRELPEVLWPAFPSLVWLGRSWSYITWLVIGMGVLLVAPELDKWLRRWLARRAASAADPPG